MNEQVIPCIDTNMGDLAPVQFEKYQIPGLQLIARYAVSITVLRQCGAWYTDPCLAVGKIHQSAAIETAWSRSAIAIWSANQTGRDHGPGV